MFSSHTAGARAKVMSPVGQAFLSVAAAVVDFLPTQGFEIFIHIIPVIDLYKPWTFFIINNFPVFSEHVILFELSLILQ